MSGGGRGGGGAGQARHQGRCTKGMAAHGLQLACSLTPPSRELPTAGVPMGYMVAAAMVEASSNQLNFLLTLRCKTTQLTVSGLARDRPVDELLECALR